MTGQQDGADPKQVPPIKWWVGRFSRLNTDAVARHPRRGAIRRYVAKHPGTSFGALRKELNMGSGVLAHHLAVLEGKRLVVSVRSGARNLYYAAPEEVPAQGAPHTRAVVYQVIIDSPGTTIARLQDAVGRSRTALRYHLEHLLKQGLIKVDQEGAAHRYWPIMPGTETEDDPVVQP